MEKQVHSIKSVGRSIYYNIFGESPSIEDFSYYDSPNLPEKLFKPCVILVGKASEKRPTWDDCDFRLYSNWVRGSEFYLENVNVNEHKLKDVVRETSGNMSIDLIVR